MTRRRLPILVAVIAVLALAVLALRPVDSGDVATGRAPAFETFDLAGEPVALDDYTGEPVLLNFWASWCVPCRREFPLLKELHDDGEVRVLGVVFQDTGKAAASFMKDEKAAWPGLVDPRGQIAEAYGVRLRPGLPVTVALDAEGRIVDRHVGELRRDDLDRLVTAALSST